MRESTLELLYIFNSNMRAAFIYILFCDLCAIQMGACAPHFDIHITFSVYLYYKQLHSRHSLRFAAFVLLL